jgi:hypothetical protein
VFKSLDHPRDGGVAGADLDAEGALTDGMEHSGRGEWARDAVGHAEADEAGRGEDEGGEGAIGIVELC